VNGPDLAAIDDPSTTGRQIGHDRSAMIETISAD